MVIWLNPEFLKSDEIKIEIMKYLQEQKWHSYYDIQTKFGMNYNLLKKHFEFLWKLDIVELLLSLLMNQVPVKGAIKWRLWKKVLNGWKN